MKASPDEPPKTTRKRIGGPKEPIVKKHNQKPITIKQIHAIYNEFDFSKVKKVLDKEVFTTAFLGYQNLKNEGKVAPGNHLLTVCDFSLSSKEPRLWILDLRRKAVLYNTLVAHGQGTGEEFAEKFSNIENSHQSSLGFYITAETYMGNNGYSLRLHGMDIGFNHRAFERAIVIHGADYVTEDFIKKNNRLGRSWGCPALPPHLARPMIDRIKEGSVVYVYHPQQEFLTASKWINQSIDKINTEYLNEASTQTQKTKYMANRHDQSTDTLTNRVPSTKIEEKTNTPKSL